MKLKLLNISTLLLLLLFLQYSLLHSQFKIENVKTNIGDDFEIGIDLFSSIDIIVHEMTMEIKVSNPSVAYLDEIVEADYKIGSSILTRINDSIYTVKLTFAGDVPEFEQNKKLFKILGTALAGNDSLCYIDFKNIQFGEINIEDLRCTLISKTGEHYIRYIRNPQLREIYPIPAISNKELKCTFTIDNNSDVELSIFDVSGRFVKKQVFENINKGTHTVSILMDLQFAMGSYYIALKTDKIYDIRKFVLIK